MSKAIDKQLLKIEKMESKFFEKNIKRDASNNSNVSKKIENKIPEKLRETLYKAFYKSFQLIFEKGSNYIEKTYNREDMKLEHDLNDIAINRKPSRKYLKRMDRQGNKSKLINSSIATLEGGVLGVLGIGIPDIPLIISLIIRQLHEISLSYGYDYKNDEERIYILKLICGALSDGSSQIQFNKEVDELGGQIDNNIVNNTSLEEQIKNTSNVLADHLLLGKFIQGIPIIGVVGGAVNNRIISRIGKYGKIKYKKRYLLSKKS